MITRQTFIAKTLQMGTLCSVLFCASAHAKDPKIAGPNSFVRVLHAVNDGPKVDVFIDGTKRLNDVTFNSISKYLRVSSGYHSVRIQANNPSRTLLSSRPYFRNGDFYTLTAWGRPTAPRLLNFNDAGGNVAYNKARITFFHLSPGSPPLSVIGTTKTGRTYRIVSSIAYGQIKASYVPAVPMTLRLVANGRTIRTLTGVAPRAGRKYAAYVMGRINNNFVVNLDVTASQ